MSNTVPEGWEVKTVGDIGSVVTGSTPSTTEPLFWGGATPFISPADFDGKIYIDKTSRTLSEEGTKKARELPKDAILVTCIGSLGGMALTSKPSVTNQQINAVVAEENQESRFHFYNILFNMHELIKSAGTTTLPIINKSTFSQINLLFPPLPEQQKIATILSSVDDVIEKTRAQIDKLKDLKTGMMQELLTKGIGHTEFKDSPVGRIPAQWQVKTTGQLCKSIVPGRNKPLSMSGDIPWLTINDLGALYVSQSKMGYGVTRQVLDDAKGKTVPKCAVIMSCVGEFGITSVAKKEVVINQQLHGFVCGKEIIPEYLCFVLSIKTKKMLNLATQTTIAYMNKANCESVLIPVPNIAEQRKISGILISIDQRLTALNDKWSVVSLIKKALMQDLLTGKVRVNLTDKESAVV